MDHSKATRNRRRRPLKRTPYVDQACIECKRRKVKCDGAEPCGKCIQYSASCNYLPHHQRPQPDSPSSSVAVGAAPSPASSRRLRHQMTPVTPAAGQTPHDQQLASPASSFQATKSTAAEGEYCGPSSSEFTLNMVSGNLKAMGIPVAILDKPSSCQTEGGAPDPISSRLAQYGPFMKLLTKDPLWDVDRADAAHDIEQWFQGTGSLYPVVIKAQMQQTANKVFDAMDSARRHGMRNRGALVESLFTDETNKLKLVLACGRTSERGVGCDQAQRLLQSTVESIEGLLWNANTINNIQMLVLMALYYYHLDEEVRTGRIIGFAARLCLEMGLHRRAVVDAFSSDEERGAGLRAFWCVYMLERRTSLGQGVPFSIQDSHIDPSLFGMMSAEGDVYIANGPVMSALLDWTKLAGKTWEALNARGEKEVEVRADELDFLDYQITQWYDRLPDDLKLQQQQQQPKATITHIQAVLWLRRSHLHNLIYRPVLQTAGRIAQYSRYAHAATRIAKDSLQTLAMINRDTNIVAKNPVFFKHLLLTAFGNLLLAVVNASSMFCDNVKVEFDIALDLIRVLSSRSPLLMDLWNRLQGLRKLRAQLGGLSAAEEEQHQHQQHHSQSGDGSGGREEAHDFMQHSSDALLFDELLPHLPLDPGLPNLMELPGDVVGVTMVRDQMNGLFDFPARASGLFDAPFTANWE